ncbi:UNVERIFIED_CONTAM: hypothetical protein Sangu_1717200 [Sesamum angustifolium]|uniref:Uncharacterized protein n=1 Tax=Sesamum angustifolium TaxID=2727405 RepID=A0AAW2MKC3_9LAMI
MANSDNGGGNGCYDRNSSLPTVVGSTIPPTDPTTGAVNAPTLDLTVGANAPAPAPTLNQTDRLVAMTLLFY